MTTPASLKISFVEATELDETKIETRVIGKWIHAVQNQHEADPNAPALESNGDVSDE